VTESIRFFTPGNVVAGIAILLGIAVVLLRPAPETPQGPAPAEERASLVLLELQGKLLVGMAQVDRQQARSQLEQLEGFAGTPNGRRALAALHAYLLPAGERSKALERLPSEGEREPLDQLVARAVSDPEEISQTEREQLLERLNWFGKLLLAPAEAGLAEDLRSHSRRLVALAGLGSLAFTAALCAGVVLLLYAIHSARRGRLAFRFRGAPETSHLYFQAFAVYLWGMLLFSSLAAVSPRFNVVGSAGAIVLALVLALMYPRFRGLDAATVRADLGLHSGRGVIREIGAGIAAYVACLPLLGLGISLTLLFQKIAAHSSGTPSSPISHPIYGMMPAASPPTLVLLFVIAAVLGPLAEEIMFRGSLYRALRGYLGPAISLLLMGFVFAAIHPQGAFAIPSLMAVAISFGLMREWRSSLVAGIVTHGLHNAVLLIGIFVAMR